MGCVGGVLVISLVGAVLFGLWRWGQPSKIVSSRSTPQDSFGNMLVMDGEQMAVSAFRDSERAENSGAIYFYAWVDGRWTEQNKLFSEFPAPYQYFGSSIALDGDLLAATSCNGRGIFESGLVTIFERRNAFWQAAQTISVEDCTPSSNLLAIEDGVLALGSRRNRQVTLYRWNGRQFIETAVLQPQEVGFYSVTDQYARLRAVALDNGRVVIALEDGAGVFLFEQIGETWQEVQALTVPDMTLQYGTAVDIHEEAILVGDTQGLACVAGACVRGGLAYLFQFDGTAWQQVAKFQAPQPADEAFFGYSVHLGEGTAVVGAPLEVAGSFGAVYHFALCDGRWQAPDRLFAGLYPRAEYAWTRGVGEVSEQVAERQFAFGEVQTAVQGGYRFPLQIAAGPALETMDEYILVGPTRSNINSERIIYQFNKKGCR